MQLVEERVHSFYVVSSVREISAVVKADDLLLLWTTLFTLVRYNGVSFDQSLCSGAVDSAASVGECVVAAAGSCGLWWRQSEKVKKWSSMVKSTQKIAVSGDGRRTDTLREILIFFSRDVRICWSCCCRQIFVDSLQSTTFPFCCWCTTPPPPLGTSHSKKNQRKCCSSASFACVYSAAPYDSLIPRDTRLPCPIRKRSTVGSPQPLAMKRILFSSTRSEV